LLALVSLTVLSGETDAKVRIDRLWLVTRSGHETPIDIEVAEEPEEKRLGLMFRTDLPDGRGMLFPYEAPRELTMWMHNTYIPLDMVFIRADGTIHRIEERAEPLSDRIISSNGPVVAVLELAGGAAERIGLKPGDKVRYSLFNGPAH
jgi:uncharacterized membrane protein (UPF0127 family)